MKGDFLMKILVTGGAGYIGSHTCIELIQAGYDVVVVDNLCNSSKESLKRVAKIVGKEIPFYEADIRDGEALDAIFAKEKVDAVVAQLEALGFTNIETIDLNDSGLAFWNSGKHI